MKGLRNEQALLAILLLLLTSLSTVSGSMPTIQSIETYFQETKPNKGTPLKLSEPLIKEKFAGYGIGGTESSQTTLNAAYGVDKEDIKELAEGFKAHGKKEHFGNCGTRREEFKQHRKEHFGNCGTRREEFKQHKKEHFGAHGKKHEHFGAHGKKHEHFGNCGTHREEKFAAHGKKKVIEPFQGNLFATV